VGAVDCGTNSIRLLVADLDGDVKTDVHREMRVVRLGQGVDRTGELAPAALERTRLALVDHAATLRDLGAERVRMVATSATRDARNRDASATMVRDVLGVRPEVVSGDEEAALSFDGATRGLDPRTGPFLVMDIGGGSTELVLGHGSPQARCRSTSAASASPSATCSTTRRPPRRSRRAEADVDAASTGSARSCRSSRPAPPSAGRLGHDRRRARARPRGLRRPSASTCRGSRRPTSPTSRRGCWP
jgi:exopolyphosphatase/pppGpp-phosphohydrolase